MVKGTRVIHRSSNLTGVVIEKDQGYYWVRLDASGSEVYIHSSEVYPYG